MRGGRQLPSKPVPQTLTQRQHQARAQGMPPGGRGVGEHPKASPDGYRWREDAPRTGARCPGPRWGHKRLTH